MPVDLRTRLGHVELPNPIMTASGCAGAGRELAQFVDVSKIGAIVTKSVMLAPAVGPPDAADGRDAERHAELDRAAGPRHRRVPAARPALAAVQGSPGRGLHRGRDGRGVRRPGGPACRTRRASPRSRSTSRARTWSTADRCSLATRTPRLPSSRRSARVRATTSRSSPSCRPTSPTSWRSPRRACRPAPTACR